MSTQANAPIIIKRKKVIAAGGHHGGAWKVAYADFVTAMMAFFMLMWLLNATTEQQRKGIADYFAPTIAINRVSGGGDGMFGGEAITSPDLLLVSPDAGGRANTEETALTDEEASMAVARSQEIDALRELEQILLGRGGESLLSEVALRHVVTRLTDEGLVIEIFALPDAPLFVRSGAVPRPLTRQLIEMVARVSAMVPNPVAISAHVAAQPIVLAENPIWDMTASRADATRRIMEEAGFDRLRVARVTGYGDRSPSTPNAPLDVRNSRIEITLLRQMR